MPLPLIARVPSTSRSLFALPEEEENCSPCTKANLPSIGGRYTLIEHIGSGSSGSAVFEATRDGDHATFAIKVLRGMHGATACALPRFIREAELTCELKHPHLAAGVEWGVDGDDHYLVMKLVRGKSLESMLMDCGRLEWQVATELVLHVARALAHLESHGIVHRDVKPENIMCHYATHGDACSTESGLIGVLIDFGLARRATDTASCDDESATKPPSTSPSILRRVATPAWSAIGSPGFMAPEQVRDARAARHAADVYGLGATWYAAITGVLPFTGSSPVKVMQQVLNGEVLPARTHVAELPPAVDELIGWLLQKKPRERPPCGPSLVAEIEAVQASPHDAQRIRRARQAHRRRLAREDALATAKHVAALALGLLLFAILVFETLKMTWDQSEAPVIELEAADLELQPDSPPDTS